MRKKVYKIKHTCGLIGGYLAIFTISGHAYAMSAFLGMKTLHATDASHNSSLFINPAISPKAAMGGVASAATQGKGFFLSSAITEKLSRNDGANVNESKKDITSYGGSILLDAGAGLYLGLSHERHTNEINSTTTNSTRNMPEEINNNLTEARASVELTANVSAGILVRFLDVDAKLYGNYFMSNDEFTKFEGSLYGPGGAVKGTLPLAGKLKQLDFGMTYIQPLKGKAEVYGEQLIISEPGIQEIAFSMVFDKYVLGMTSRNWVYKLDDRFFGTTYPNDDMSSVRLFGLDVDKNVVFPLNHLQFGLDIKRNNGLVFRGSVALEDAQFNFSPEEDLPKIEDGKEVMSYKVYSGSVIIDRNGIVLEGMFNYYDRGHSWDTGSNRRSYSGELTDYIVTVAKRL